MKDGEQSRPSPGRERPAVCELLLQMRVIQGSSRWDSQDGTGHLCNQEIPLASPSCPLCGVQALLRKNSQVVGHLACLVLQFPLHPKAFEFSLGT